MIVNLTEEFIRTSLHCPPDRRKIEFTDSKLPGLLIEVTASSPGVGSFRLRYRDGAQRTRYASLGRTNTVELQDARAAAKKMKAAIALGTADPSADKKAAKAVLTFDEFWVDHCYPYLQSHKKTASKDNQRYQYRLKSEFGHLKLTQITRQQLQNFHSRLKTEGLAGATCDHEIQVMRRALNLAVEWNLLEKNPAERFPLYRDPNDVEHYLGDEELGRLLHVLSKDKNQAIARIVLWLLATGARLNEALQARWDHVDRTRRIWRIPALNSKSKRVRAIPLNDAAMEVLDALDTEGEYEFLFINKRLKKPYGNIAKVFLRLREEAGLPHLRIHDLRHQFASHLVSAGKSLYQVQTLLGHSDPKVTQRYSHLSTAALRDATDAASDAMSRASKPAETITE